MAKATWLSSAKYMLLFRRGRLAWVCLAVWECDLQAFTWNSDNPGCVSTVCICPLFTFTHTHTASLARSQCLLSAGQFLCVHCQCCVSTVCTCPLLTFIHTLPKYHSVNAFTLLAHSCVSTVSVVCPRSVYVHCSLSHTLLTVDTQELASRVKALTAC